MLKIEVGLKIGVKLRIEIGFKVTVRLKDRGKIQGYFTYFLFISNSVYISSIFFKTTRHFF